MRPRVGFFRRLFGGAKAQPPAPKARPFAPDAFPFAGEVRVRHEEYDRLSTSWWAVAVNSPEEWGAKVAEMQEGIRRHFGFYTTKKGEVVPRWGNRTWERVRRSLIVERR